MPIYNRQGRFPTSKIQYIISVTTAATIIIIIIIIINMACSRSEELLPLQGIVRA